MSKISNLKYQISKLAFLLRKPKVIIVTGNDKVAVKEAISQVLKPYFKLGQEILIFESSLRDETELEKFKFLINKSYLPILVVAGNGDAPFDIEEIQKLAKIMPSYGYLILNFDNSDVKKIANVANSKILTYGFQENSDFQASDVKLDEGTNFKINHKGNIVPVWLEQVLDNEKIYPALAAAIIGTVLGLNLVEVSQALKNYHSIRSAKRTSFSF